jgi:hypothetical protein
LGPFEFIYKLPPELAVLVQYGVDIPTEYADTAARLNNVLSFLRLMKPAHTTFTLNTALTVQDKLLMSDLVSFQKIVGQPTTDTVSLSDRPSNKVKPTFTDTVFSTTGNALYDGGAYYDGTIYDGGSSSSNNIQDAMTYRVFQT